MTNIGFGPDTWRSTKGNQNKKHELFFKFYFNCKIVLLIRCQLPELRNGFVTPTSEKVVSINESAKFTCSPGYELVGSNTVQCVFDDAISDTGWSPELPQCVLLGKQVYPKY